MLFKTLFFFSEILKKVGTAKPKMALLHCTASVQSLGSLCTEASAKCSKPHTARARPSRARGGDNLRVPRDRS